MPASPRCVAVAAFPECCLPFKHDVHFSGVRFLSGRGWGPGLAHFSATEEGALLPWPQTRCRWPASRRGVRVLAAAWPGAASPVQVARPGLAQAGLEELPGADIAVKCCSASAGVLWYGTACCRHCPCCPQGCMPCVNLQLLSLSCCWMGPCASSQAFLCCSLCRDVVCHQELSVRALGVTAIRPSIRTTAGRPPPHQHLICWVIPCITDVLLNSSLPLPMQCTCRLFSYVGSIYRASGAAVLSTV